MKIRIQYCFAFMLVGVAVVLFAERTFAQVVILPSQQSFSYSGVISVPDAGSASLGGSGYSRSGSLGSGWGPYGPRAIGGSTSSSSVSVSVQIIDLKAMEESMNAANTPKSNTANTAPTVEPNGKAVAGQPAKSPTAAGAKKPAASESDVLKPKARNRSINAPDLVMMKRFLNDGKVKSNPEKAFEDVRYYFGMGQDADALRHFESAGVYYRMAFEAMTPAMRERYEQFALAHAQEDEKNKAAIEANQKFRRSF